MNLLTRSVVAAEISRMTDDLKARGLPEGEVLRINEGEAAGAFFLGALLIFIGLGGVFATSERFHHVPGWLAPVSGLVCIAIGIQIAASSRSGLIVEPEGIAVQGAFTRRRWRWNEVSGFELAARITGGPRLRIDLVDGAHVRALGFKSRSRDQRKFAEQRVAELNRRAEAARSAAVITPADGESGSSSPPI